MMIPERVHDVKAETPCAADVHLNGIVFYGIEVTFDPKPQYEGGRVYAKIYFRSEYMDPLVEELYHSRDDVYLEIEMDEYELRLDDVNHHEHRFGRSDIKGQYVCLGGWVEIHDR